MIKDNSLLRMSGAELAIVMQKEAYAKEQAKEADAKQEIVRVEKQAVKEQAKQVADVHAALQAQRLLVAELEASADKAVKELDERHAKVLVAERDAEQTRVQAAVAAKDADAGKTEEEKKYLDDREELIRSYLDSLDTIEEKLRSGLPAQFRNVEIILAILDGARSDIVDGQSEDDEYQDDECQDVDEQNLEEILEGLDTAVKRKLDLGELAVVCMRLITKASCREHHCRTCYKCDRY